MTGIKSLTGMRGFMLVWVGQVISLLGTGMTQFALAVWAFELTGQATALALIGVSFAIPNILLMPLAGVIVDRYDRKMLLVLTDLVAGLGTVVIFLLLLADQLAIWHLYAVSVVQGAFASVQWPASSAAISTMIPKEQYTRANGLMMLVGPSSQLFAPLLAGALLGVIGLQGILTIDIVTFVVAIGALLVVFVPSPEESAAGREGAGNVWRQMLFGGRYILQRPALLALQTMFLVGNFFVVFAFILQTPMILARTGSDEGVLALVQTIGAVGGIVGGVVISVWGGFKRRVTGVFLGWAVVFASWLIVGLGRPEPAWAALPLWGIGMFIISAAIPLIDSSNQAIWQSKVPPDVQGRVFSIRSLIARAVTPIAALIAGPLADVIMEPAMLPDGALAGTFGWLVGTGPGAGMSLIMLGVAIVGAIFIAFCATISRIRNVELILPDHDQPAPDEGLEPVPVAAD